MTAETVTRQVAAMAEAYAGQPPGDVVRAFTREQAALAAGGIPERRIAVGAVLTDADLLDPFGAAELAGRGVTANVYRPGSVDTAMQAWIRGQSPEKIGAALHERFARNYEEGSLITPEQSARSLMDHLASNATGEIWNVNSNRPMK